MADPVRKMFFGKLGTYLKEKLPDESAAIANCLGKQELLAIYDAHPELHPAGSAHHQPHREARSRLTLLVRELVTADCREVQQLMVHWLQQQQQLGNQNQLSWVD